MVPGPMMAGLLAKSLSTQILFRHFLPRPAASSPVAQGGIVGRAIDGFIDL